MFTNNWKYFIHGSKPNNREERNNNVMNVSMAETAPRQKRLFNVITLGIKTICGFISNKAIQIPALTGLAFFIEIYTWTRQINKNNENWPVKIV
jgi:hypothetical protein